LLDRLSIGLVNDRHVHFVNVDASSRTCVIHSDISERKIKLYSWEEIWEAIQIREIGISVRFFLDKIKVLESSIKGKAFLREQESVRVNLRSLMMPI
jgi:hypothetical protein